MDGTLVDTEPYWIETEFEMAQRCGGRWTREDALSLVGKDLRDAGRYIRDHMGVDLTPEQIVEELLDGVVARVRRNVPWRPGALDLLVTLRGAGVPCALVTMSYQRFVAPILEHLPARYVSCRRHRRHHRLRQAASRAVSGRRRRAGRACRPTASRSRTRPPA